MTQDSKAASVKRPSFLAWTLLAFVFVTIMSSIFEAVPIIVTDDNFPGGLLEQTNYLISHTVFLKLFAPITFATIACLICYNTCNFALTILRFYVDDIHLIPEHLVVAMFILSIALVAISLYKNRNSLTDDLQSDSIFKAGIEFLKIATGLSIGVALGQAKHRRDFAALQSSIAVAQNKILKLHEFVHQIKRAPPIPPDLYP